MATTTADSMGSVPDSRPAPAPRAASGPVFIGDALTPVAGTTLLHLLWPMPPSDR